MRHARSDEQAFLEFKQRIKEMPSGCWEWQGARNLYNYKRAPITFGHVDLNLYDGVQHITLQDLHLKWFDKLETKRPQAILMLHLPNDIRSVSPT